MKFNYSDPELEVVLFESEDIMTESGEDNEIPFDDLNEP